MFKSLNSARAWSALGCIALAITGCTGPSPSVKSIADEPYGHLELASSSGEICNIPITLGVVRKINWGDNIPSCNFSNFSKIRFVNTPSALTVKIRSFEYGYNYVGDIEIHTDCWSDRGQYGYRIDLKTVGSITEGRAFDIDDALSTERNSPVTANVRLLSKSTSGNLYRPINEYFSCFHFYPDIP